MRSVVARCPECKQTHGLLLEVSTRDPSPYAYLVEMSLATGHLSALDVLRMGLDPRYYLPTPRSALAHKFAPAPPFPYDCSDPIIQAFTQAFMNGAITYDQVDMAGLHPLHLLACKRKP